MEYLDKEYDVKVIDEKFIFLHTRSRLNITWKDLAKVAMGKIVNISLCFKIEPILQDGLIHDVLVPDHYTKVVVSDKDSVNTVEAQFTDELHK